MNHFANISRSTPANPVQPAASHAEGAPLHAHVERAVRQYFDNLNGESTSQLYDLVLKEVEKPLLSVVLEQTRGNQTRAANMLGLNRGTLRKKLKMHGLMNE